MGRGVMRRLDQSQPADARNEDVESMLPTQTFTILQRVAQYELANARGSHSWIVMLHAIAINIENQVRGHLCI